MFNIFKSERSLSWSRIKEGDKITYNNFYEKTKILYGLVERKFYMGIYKPTLINRILNRSKKNERYISVNWVDYKGKKIYSEDISEDRRTFYFYKHKKDYKIIKNKIVRLENCVIGDMVVPSDEYDYYDADVNQITYGIIVGFKKIDSYTKNNICIVEWFYKDTDYINKCYCRIGPIKFDLYFYEEQEYEEDEQ